MKLFTAISLSFIHIIHSKIDRTKQTTYIDSFIENKMAESGMVGMRAAIIVNKKVAWTRGYGYADKPQILS